MTEYVMVSRSNVIIFFRPTEAAKDGVDRKPETEIGWPDCPITRTVKHAKSPQPIDSNLHLPAICNSGVREIILTCSLPGEDKWLLPGSLPSSGSRVRLCTSHCRTLQRTTGVCNSASCYAPHGPALTCRTSRISVTSSIDMGVLRLWQHILGRYSKRSEQHTFRDRHVMQHRRPLCQNFPMENHSRIGIGGCRRLQYQGGLD